MNDFLKDLSTVLDEYGFTALTGKQTKNNGVKLTSLTLIEKGVKKDISPVFYMDSFYENYKDGRSLDDIAKYLIQKASEPSIFSQDVLKNITNLDNLRVKLVNVCKNDLSNTLHRNVLDDRLAIVLYSMVGNGGTVTITKNNVSLYHLSETELIDIGIKNVIKEGYKYQTIAETLGIPELNDEMPMVVLSNNKYTFGAVAMLSINVLSEISDKYFNHSDLFILPSSIHEVIVIEKNGNAESLKEIVREVNLKEISDEEYLSDDVFIFNYDKKEIN